MSETHITRTEPEGVSARPILYVAVGFLDLRGRLPWRAFPYITAASPAPGRDRSPEPFPAPQLQRTPLSDLENAPSAASRRS